MFWNLVLVAAGLLLLALAPGRFVAGSAALADVWGMPRVLVGAVVIGFGTSAPEMLVSGLAAAQGDADVGTGNIIGSNVANLSLILGFAALISTMAVPHGLVRSELPLLAAATLGFALAVQDGLGALDGALLALGFAVAMLVIVRRAKHATAAADEPELEAGVGEIVDEEESHGRGRLIGDALGGLIGTVVGAQLLVTGAVAIADDVGLSGGFVGMSLVAVGTSVPELVTALAAARAGEQTLIIGNLIGSNIFNCLGVGAIVGLLGGGAVHETSLTGGVLLMLAVTAVACLALGTGKRVSRWEAGALVAAYAVVMPLLATT